MRSPPHPPTRANTHTRSQATAFVSSHVELTNPSKVVFCDGSAREWQELTSMMVASGSLQRVTTYPNSFLARSPPDDVARVESKTFICSERERDAGPLNNWRSPSEMRASMRAAFTGASKGRTLYVVPFAMGPLGSPLSKFAVQLTDSPYVVLNTHIMTRCGESALSAARSDEPFVELSHSVCAPLEPGAADVPWPSNAAKTAIAHFPETRVVMSTGSGYGGNALLGKKSLALRLGSVLARDEGWFAEHMALLSVTNPKGEKVYVAASFPSACGKTAFSTMVSTLPGYKIALVGDDISWLKFDKDGVLRAINPEAGLFGVAPGMTADSPAFAACKSGNTIFTNVAATVDGGVWWEGLSSPPPSSASSWLRRPWTPADAATAAHANARFTTPASQVPCLDRDWEAPEGVPVSAIIFGGRRKDTVPLCVETLDWTHGVFAAATLSSETTSAAEQAKGQLRNDPFAMRPFIGYDVASYFAHWLAAEDLRSKATGGRVLSKTTPLPKIFQLNVFRKGADGKFLWPGYGDNARILAWILERVAGRGAATETAIGRVPDHAAGAINTDGLNLSPNALADLVRVNKDEWEAELQRAQKFLDEVGAPKALHEKRAWLAERLKK